MIKFPIIDSHVHIFPDKIASKAVQAIGEYYDIQMAASGTVNDLLSRGNKIGVKRYIVHSSATTVAQVRVINDFIVREVSAHEELIGFGTLHPQQSEEGIVSELARITAHNLLGIKLHPEFQGFSISDENMLPLFRAAEGKLPLLIHMGDPQKDSSHPGDLVRIIDAFPDLTIIAAHLGGYRMWEDSIRHLVGKNIYLDTSSALFFLGADAAIEIIRAHGIDRVLFGTDYPMWDH
ncbi:MAG TPA: amidohydrolase family protein, partial [Spirochaetota bacterium]